MIRDWLRDLRKYLIWSTATLLVVTGSVRAQNPEDLKKAALALPKIAESIAGKKIRKVVIVPNKLVNIATN